MPRRFPIRAKLTFGALAPLLIAFCLCSLTGLYIINSKIESQAQEKVRTDLNSAREVYRNELERIAELVDLTAASPFAVSAFSTGNRPVIAQLLSSLQRKKHLDILNAADARGRILYRAHNPRFSGDRPANDFLNLALKGVAVTGSTVLSGKQLAAEYPDLARRASISVVPTPHSRASVITVVRSGMVMVSAAPVRNAAGAVVGALYGAVLLNHNNTLVDKIKEIVYEGVKFNGTDVGSATLFLGDTRIATNVLTSGGDRAIGTRLSEEVFNRVLLEGKKWVARAFVVNDWYLTAYEPILDLRGEAIGSLYVGMLEKPYIRMRKDVDAILYLVLFVTALIGIAVSGFIGTLLARPIRELEKLTHRVTLGERDLRIQVRSNDEVGDLADAFNLMTQALTRQDAELALLHRGLELKVQERTAQLNDNNRLLLQAQVDLARAEKLADLGVVAAGVAHEINTPLAIIRGNTEVLEMCLPPEHANREEVGIISRQTERMAKIVGNLLAFARQKSLDRREFAIHRMLDDILGQIGHQVAMDGITIVRQYQSDLAMVRGAADQLRQVFSNLILNAIQAMPQGGSLTLVTGSLAPGAGWLVEIADSGAGILPEQLEKIFTPFYTTKDNGTGLGLSVSYGIVKDHGGEIEVESSPGEGTRFRIVIPAENPQEQAGSAQ